MSERNKPFHEDIQDAQRSVRNMPALKTLADLEQQHKALKAAAQAPTPQIDIASTVSEALKAAAQLSPQKLPQRQLLANAPLTSTSDLGILIQNKRKAMGLTQQEFADLTGVGRRFVSELEAGKPTLEFGRVLKVCQSVGLDLIVAAR